METGQEARIPFRPWGPLNPIPQYRKCHISFQLSTQTLAKLKPKPMVHKNAKTHLPEEREEKETKVGFGNPNLG